MIHPSGCRPGTPEYSIPILLMECRVKDSARGEIEGGMSNYRVRRIPGGACWQKRLEVFAGRLTAYGERETLPGTNHTASGGSAP